MRADSTKQLSPAGQRRRSELMDAAVRLAARNGFSRTRVSDIVGRVGVGQGVFYWYFESKDALYREIMLDSSTRLRRFQGAVIDDEPDPIRRIAKGIWATMEFVVHNRHVFAFLDHAIVDPPKRTQFQQQRTEAQRVHVVDTARHVAEAMDLGLVRRGDPEVLAHAISGVVDRLARVCLGAGADRAAQDAIDFCLGGLLATSTVDVGELRATTPIGDEGADLLDRVGAGRPVS